jgi:hypothetical protein
MIDDFGKPGEGDQRHNEVTYNPDRNDCYWSAIELGIPMAELVKKLDMTLAAISYAVKRGEITAKENNYTLVK